MKKVLTAEIYLDQEKGDCFCKVFFPDGEEPGTVSKLGEGTEDSRFAFALVDHCGTDMVDVRAACSRNHHKPVDLDLAVTLFNTCPHLMGLLQMLDSEDPPPGLEMEVSLIAKLRKMMNDYRAVVPS